MQEASRVLAFGVALFVAAVLARAAWLKLRDVPAFAALVAGYGLLPGWAVRPAAWGIAGAEATLAVGLLVPGVQRGACIGAAVLFGVFAAAMLVNLARGRGDIACGCGDPRKARPIGAGAVAQAIGLAAAVLAAGFVPQAWPGLAAGGVAVAAALTAGMLAMAAGELAA